MWSPRTLSGADSDSRGARTVITLAVALAVGGALACRNAPPEATTTQLRPNLVVYLVDTLRRDRLGVYGNDRGLTPAIDAFAREASVYERAVAQSSWTRPAVASIFTGLRPLAHGVTTVKSRLPEAADTLAERLQRSGYQTAAFSTNWHVHERSGMAQGFGTFDFNAKATSSQALVDRVEVWLAANRPARQGDTGDPFFLYVHALDPHWPYDPPEHLLARLAPGIDPKRDAAREHLNQLLKLRPRERPASGLLTTFQALYDAEVAAADEGFGRLLATLARDGTLENTLVILLSDHGEEFNEHGRMFHAQNLHTEAIDIPWIVRWPGQSAGTRSRALVEHIDVLPTLLLAAGLKPPVGLPGRALSDPSRTEASLVDTLPREAVSHLDYRGRRGLALTSSQGDRLARWIQPQTRAFARTNQLYDLLRDPSERRSLTGEAPQHAAALQERLAELLRAERAHALDPEVAGLDEETRRGLHALGYLGN